MPQPTPNRLSDETSPYLLQHAENPVAWLPWGDEALTLAKESGKPILLSIGYSACHWCHVMAHESFEDEATAEVMNRLFVNIKVDREERPDIDKIYQLAHQLLTQRPGGWPLTMFIDPADQRPFFGGTYFPKTARYGMPAFVELLERVADHFHANPAEVQAQGDKLVEILGQLEPSGPKAAAPPRLTDEPLQSAREKIAQSFDREYGGIGSAPKFPHASTLERLLRHWRHSAADQEPDVDALYLVSLTLLRMAEGGIYDQLAGGFCRYSVDRYWQIPHFEKMLYDNGPLLALYGQAFLATGDPLYQRIAAETADYLTDDLRDANGGFYSTRDADSEGEEGRYYVWTPDAVKALLDDTEYALVAPHFGLDQDANFEGSWHLTVRQPVDALASTHKLEVQTVTERIAEARRKLLIERATREAPGRDDKQLTAWNALAIRGFAIAGRALGRDDLVSIASDAIDFIAHHLRVGGRLMASYKDGEAKFPAYLDDHAFLLDAAVELLQARFSLRHLTFAVEIADLLLEHFFDADSGGFYFTANDAERLMHRPKPLSDDAMPSGNGVAVIGLQRLGFLLAEQRYLDAAESTLRFAWRSLQEYPQGHVSLATALEEYLYHPEIIVVRGDAAELAAWQEKIAAVYAPRRLVFGIDRSLDGLPGVLASRKALDGGPVAYRCVGHECSLPLTNWDALAAALKES
ncbi:MAG: thioredoxin domain-containing protein [Pseudomonadota bacterium]